jgi:hypothetical protein
MGSLLALALAACSEERSAATRVLGTGASIVVPAGLEPARTYSGFEDERGLVSVRVSELRNAMPDAQSAVAEDLGPKLGHRLRSQERLVVGGLPASLLLLDTGREDAPWTDWQLMVFGEKDTLDVRGRFPRGEHERWQPALRDALLGVQWRPAPTTGVFEGPGFRLRPPPGYVHAVSALGVYTFTRYAEGQPSILDPSFSVVLQAGTLAPEELLAEFDRRLQARPGTTDWNVIQSSAVDVGGIPAREVLAHARLSKEDEPFFLVGALFVDQGVIWWLHGEARVELEAVELPRMRACLFSFERVR